MKFDDPEIHINDPFVQMRVASEQDGIIAQPIQPTTALAPASPTAPIVCEDGTIDTGKILTKGIIESLYPTAICADIREKAHRKFIQGTRISDLALEFKVDENLICHWVMNGHWIDEKELLLRAKEGEDALALSEIRIDKRRTIIKRQLTTASQLRDQIENAVSMNKDHSPSHIKLLAEGAKLVADVETRAIGICESGAITTQSSADAEEKIKTGKQPLVMIFQNGSLPPIVRTN